MKSACESYLSSGYFSSFELRITATAVRYFQTAAPEGCDVTTKVHPTQKAAEIKEYDEEPILKMKVEKLAGVGENGVNGKNEQAEPIIAVENDVIDHEEEIVDVVAVSETSPMVPEAEEAHVREDSSNGVREEPFLLSPRLRGSAKKGPSSSRSSSPADSLHKKRTYRNIIVFHHK